MATASPTAPAPRDCDVAIIGAGPTGLSAAIYTAREGLSTVLLEGAAVGGMAAITDVIDNYPGFPDGVGGAELSERMHKQAERFGAELIFGSGVTSLKTDGSHTLIETYAGAVRAKTVLIATGSTYRQLGVPGEAELIGKGVHFCATCDAPLYRGKNIVSVGGGNSAMQESLFIARFAHKVTLLVRGPELKGTEVLRQQVAKEPKIEIVYNAAVTEVHAVNGKFAAVMAKVGDEIKAYEADGVFVFIGLIPNSAELTGVKLDTAGFVQSDAHYATNLPGVFVAGDIRSGSTWQIASAVGEGVTAALEIRKYLDAHHKMRYDK